MTTGGGSFNAGVGTMTADVVVKLEGEQGQSLPAECPDCEGTGWSYHEHLPVERSVGCESCGGCGDERGTGIAP